MTMTAIESKATTPKVGDIISCSWGYDQTNVDFYKVTKVTAKSVTFYRLENLRTSTGPMCGETIPGDNPAAYRSAPQTRRWKSDSRFGWHCNCQPGGFAYLWDGKPEFFSEWA